MFPGMDDLMEKLIKIIMIALIMTGCSSNGRLVPLKGATSATKVPSKPSLSIKSASRMESEENDWIKNSLKEGLPPTDANLRRYCEISSNMIKGAILDLFNTLHGSPSINLPEDAKYIDFTKEQYMGLINHGMSDESLMTSLQSDPRAAIYVSNMYNLRCQSNPGEYIYNYKKVFHSSKKNSESKTLSKECQGVNRSSTADEIAACIKSQQ